MKGSIRGLNESGTPSLFDAWVNLGLPRCSCPSHAIITTSSVVVHFAVVDIVMLSSTITSMSRAPTGEALFHVVQPIMDYIAMVS
jgi:hypothetical protein